MSIFNGKHISVEITGESHAPQMRLVCKGFPDFEWDGDELAAFLARRKPNGGVYSTKRAEPDLPVFERTGDGFCAVIKNTDVRSSDYSELYAKPRPSHADYAWYLKDGQKDFSGGGRFSARLTAMLCVAGGIALQYLESRGITVAAYISRIGSVQGRSYSFEPFSARVAAERRGSFPSLTRAEEMTAQIEEARAAGDSVGGEVECIASGLPGGYGDCLFDGLEGKISSLIFAIPAVKGVEFGGGFELCSMRGSEANDGLEYVDGAVRQITNNAGGINGGISNGGDITVRVAFRPTPSIALPQRTVDLESGQNVTISVKGRHDACVAVRAVPCVESAVALALLDEIID